MGYCSWLFFWTDRSYVNFGAKIPAADYSNRYTWYWRISYTTVITRGQTCCSQIPLWKLQNLCYLDAII